jgi:broad specificity phosphatase PhoE
MVGQIDPCKHSLFLVRHGECEMNLHLGERVGGRASSSPLTTKGRDQAAQLGTYLERLFAERKISTQDVRFVSSTAVRAVDTARIAMKQMAVDEARLVSSPELEELDMGEFAGQPRAEIYNEERLREIARDVWHFKPPKGESQREVEERVMAYLGQVIDQHDTGVTIVVYHGLAIKCTLRHILGSRPEMSRKIETENCSISHVAHCRSSGWHVKSVAFDVLYSANVQ